MRFPWPTGSRSTEIEQIQVTPGLELHFKLFRYFLDQKTRVNGQEVRGNFKLSTRAQSPAGAGLGGSSALSVALIGALSTWACLESTEPMLIERDGEKFIEIVRDVKLRVIKIPAGLQDYYSGMYGGLQNLQWGAGKHDRVEYPKEQRTELESRLLLFYSGQSRNSGINNWTLFKSFIDYDSQVRERFEKISAHANQLGKALKQKNWKNVQRAIAGEWEVRKTLAPGITTPTIEAAFAEAQKLGDVTGKVCGAGGGGCFFIYLGADDPVERSQLRQLLDKKFADQGIRPLPFRTVPSGLEVQING